MKTLNNMTLAEIESAISTLYESNLGIDLKYIRKLHHHFCKAQDAVVQAEAAYLQSLHELAAELRSKWTHKELADAEIDASEVLPLRDRELMSVIEHGA